MFRTTPSSVYWIAVGAFALGMASYVMAGLVPMIEQAFNVQVAVAAQLVAVFSLAYGIGSPIFVALLPPQRQRLGLLSALAIFVLANMASAVVDDFAALLVCRAIAGLGAGVYLATGITACVAVSEPNGRGRAIAIIMAGMASGTVLGVPFSLLLAELSGWQAALWLIALLGAASWLGLVVNLPALPAGPQMTIRSKLLLLENRNVVSTLLVSLLAAVSSLGMYTFIAPLMTDPAYGGIDSVTPYLWVWGLGGVAGSFLITPLVERIEGPVLIFIIMLVLTASLLALPLAAAISPWLAMIPIAIWGCVGWALQVPQNNELISERERNGDGNLAVALNESALYLGSALGAGAGGFLLLLEMPSWTLAIGAGAVAFFGAALQLLKLRTHRSRPFGKVFRASVADRFK
ncbi:sugar transporter [Pseudomonas sp. FW306-02-F02-AA]|uniref:Sugar transporter n=1 Tax=Pseudomonas fluorescens TaxID=294 RepID=A0A0N9WJG4_PSEFL|nr:MULTISPECIES: MFS transporter [Pseudomonas]ALI04934.1 sugar transporter [Pseudomonas fluorescens]PMZ05657.1 sugar transporter [Pseudomonas sp. FW306-02-F02-AB]PMZ11225.1 sugar transporter [Pseudomonas sp. FW306-02-H06C]PMZ12642.1 sugar transporter [Pseudomonas sp. FW306-02-F02-AA]PMZ23426.1 sugar transporter [Pseudomonas sp. FW306-02-F08-AA]